MTQSIESQLLTEKVLYQRTLVMSVLETLETPHGTYEQPTGLFINNEFVAGNRPSHGTFQTRLSPIRYR